MSVPFWRNFVYRMMVVFLPLSLLAADTGSAVVHSKGGVWVNGAEVADSTAIFPGDVLETKPGFVAELDAEGSAVLIQPESIVKFQGNFVSLEHGSVSVGTSTLFAVHVNCIRVEPIVSERTQYDVTDFSGTVQVSAKKNDVNITQGGALKKMSPENNTSQSATVHEGQQASRIESIACGAPLRPGSPGSSGLNTKWMEIGGGGAGGVIVLCLLLCRGSSHNSVSPSQP
jgi:hypothetical protein